MSYVPKNYVDKVGPAMPAAWLNQLDALANNVFDSVTTKPAARTALTSDAPLEISNGGTDARNASTALSNLGGLPTSTFNSFLSTQFTQAGITSITMPQTPAELAAGITPSNYAYPPGHFNRYGAVGDNVADDSAAIQKAFNSGALVTGISNATYYCGTTTITIANANVAALLYGVILRTAVNGTSFLTITGTGCELRGVEIYGRGNSSYVGGETLITASGTAVGARVSDLYLVDCYLHDVGSYGLYSEWGQRFHIINCKFLNIGYAAILLASGLDCEIIGGIIDTVSPGTSGNTYGVSLTRRTDISDNLAVVPRTKNCKVVGMTVKNNTIWDALGTHAGEELLFEANIIENCKYGVAMGPSKNIAGNYVWAPQNCKSVGNQITGSAGGGGYGVSVVGAGTVTGTPIEAAAGCSLIGDTVIQCGVPGASTSGGFVFYYTNGLQVIAPTALDCYSNGVVFYHDNYGLTLAGGNIVDPHDPTNVCACVRFDAGYNTGVVSGVSVTLVNPGLDTHVADRGLYMVVNTASTIQVGPNYNTCTTPFAGLPALTTGWGTPVGNAVIASYNITDAGGANSNTNKAVASIIVALKGLGIFGA